MLALPNEIAKPTNSGNHHEQVQRCLDSHDGPLASTAVADTLRVVTLTELYDAGQLHIFKRLAVAADIMEVLMNQLSSALRRAFALQRTVRP